MGREGCLRGRDCTYKVSESQRSGQAGCGDAGRCRERRELGGESSRAEPARAANPASGVCTLVSGHGEETQLFLLCSKWMVTVSVNSPEACVSQGDGGRRRVGSETQGRDEAVGMTGVRMGRRRASGRAVLRRKDGQHLVMIGSWRREGGMKGGKPRPSFWP